MGIQLWRNTVEKQVDLSKCSSVSGNKQLEDAKGRRKTSWALFFSLCVSSVKVVSFSGSHTLVHISPHLQLSYSVYFTDSINQICSNEGAGVLNKKEQHLIHFSHSMEEVVSEDLWPSNTHGKK